MLKEIRSVDERSTHLHWHLRSVNSVSITSPSHWPSSTSGRRLGAGMQRLASAVSQQQPKRGGAYWQTKAFQTSRLSPNYHLFPSKMTTCGSVYRAKSVNAYIWWGRHERAPVNVLKASFAGKETCGDRYRIEHVERKARPASGHSCRQTCL